MKKHLLAFLMTCLSVESMIAQTPIIDEWEYNNSGSVAKYYNTSGTLVSTGVSADITKLCYSSTYVYIETSGMPEVFGPWTNPGSPSDQDFIFRFPKNPTAATSNSNVDVPTVFTVAVLVNGAPVFGNGDARSYKVSTNQNASNGDGKWNGNAYYSEGHTLDSTFAGHVNQNGTYHTHATPKKLYKDYATTVHSPLVGFAFDGYPIYGPYGYSSAMDNTSGVTRMESGYALRTFANNKRTTLPDGTAATGPDVSGSFPLGSYIEDFEFVGGGHLDKHNGRYCVTPEYPGGTYAYFVTVESDGVTPKFPYYLGESYYGVVDQANLTPNSTITFPTSGTSCLTLGTKNAIPVNFEISPNPVQNQLSLQADESQESKVFDISVTNSLGEVVFRTSGSPNSTIDMSSYIPGIYHITLYNESTGAMETKKFVKQ